MTLRDQPYLPLYIQDFMTDEKLSMCSASANGVYIRIMCIMHKSNEYGVILLRQKDKQTKNDCKNFSIKLSKMMPFDLETVHKALLELLDEGVLYMEDDKLLQKRMIRDNEISLTRSISGQKGGFATAKRQANKPAKEQANTEYEDESVIETDNKGEKKVNPIQQYFYDKYLEIKGEIYVADFGKDGKIFKELQKVVDDTKIKSLIDRYLKSTDEFIQTAGFTVGVFRSQINKLISSKPKSKYENNRDYIVTDLPNE